MIIFVPLFLILLTTPVDANEHFGKIYFGKNLAKPLSEHTDRLYLTVDDSEKLYFDRTHPGPVATNLDVNADHMVNVYFDGKITQSWILNFGKLKTHSVVIWRSSGSWRMEPLESLPTE